MKRTTIKKKLAAIGLLVMTTMAMTGCGGGGNQDVAGDAQAPQENDAQTVTVGIIQQAEHAALESAKEGFMAGLAESGFTEEKITFDIKNAQGDKSNLQTIAEGFNNNDVDLICAIGTTAAQSAAQATIESQIPIVATAVTDYVSASLVESNEAPNTNVTGTSDMNPIKEQLELMMELVPDLETVGVIYTSSEPNSQLQVEMLHGYAEEMGLNVQEATITTVNDIQQAAQSLIGKIQGLYVPTDNLVASAVPNLVMITEPEGLPIICGEAGTVVSGGTATIGIDYYDLGVQTGQMAARILNGESQPAEMPIEYLQDMSVTLNQGAADRIGLTFPAAMVEKAGDNIIQ